MVAISKHGLYQFVVFVWGVLVFGGVVLVLSGNAEPYVAASDVPITGPLEMFGVSAGLFVVGALVVARLERGSWHKAARRANLTSTGGGIIGKPDLEGTVAGRQVRVRTIKRRTGSSSEGGSNKTTYTIVEAELDEPATQGLVLSSSGDEVIAGRSVNVNLSPETTAVNGVAVLGNEDLARDVLTNRVVDALRQPRKLETVYVGNVTDLLLDAIPDVDGPIRGAITGRIESGVEDRIPADAGTVRMERKGVILNGTELEDQTRAMAAVADSFEHATARVRDTGGGEEEGDPANDSGDA